MNEVGILSAILGGILTFIAPCTFPLIPAYIGFLSGGGKSDDAVETQHRIKIRVFLNAIFFVLGFTSVFVFFGLISGSLGTFFALHRASISQVGGLVVIVFGLVMLGLFRLPAFGSVRRMPTFLKPGRPFSAFLLGFFFGFGWSPCIGPILGTILFLAGSVGSAGSGAILLLCYSAGLALPFLIIAYLYGSTFSYVVRFQKYLPFIETASGIFLIIIGLLLVTGKFGLFNVWLGGIWQGAWYTSLMNYM